MVKGLPMKPIREAQYHDELNLARLNVILATNRTKLQHWRKKLQLDSEPGVGYNNSIQLSIRTSMKMDLKDLQNQRSKNFSCN